MMMITDTTKPPMCTVMNMMHSSAIMNTANIITGMMNTIITTPGPIPTSLPVRTWPPCR